MIANEYAEIERCLRLLIDNPERISEYSKKSYDCGIKNHNSKDIERIFVDTFVKAAAKHGDK